MKIISLLIVLAETSTKELMYNPQLSPSRVKASTVKNFSATVMYWDYKVLMWEFLFWFRLKNCLSTILFLTVARTRCFRGR